MTEYHEKRRASRFIRGAAPDNARQGIESYADLLTWGQQTGLLSAANADRLRNRVTTAIVSPEP